MMQALIFIIAFILCGDIYAGPIENADQFQAKTVKSVLRSSGNQNFKAKEEYIEGMDAPGEDGKDKDYADSMVNTASGEESNADEAGMKEDLLK